ncbi:MAG: barstar family protein [Sandaracinus sp.]|nr:barstar family protein [Sandaracinus sp.]MCB9624616.1 barstar family protein [Sandaracinus sp.]MCB9636196.1 barstar family protein [Sandaracinus sp.]
MTVTKPTAGVHLLEAEAIDARQRELSALGFALFVLPESGVDGATFFDAARSTLPLDPPVGSSWDALSDSLWEGLHQHPSRRLAIVWKHTGEMAQQSPTDFALALDVLSQVAELLADSTATVGNPKELVVLVERPELDPRRGW